MNHFETPERIIYTGNLVLIYSNYVIKVFLHADLKMKDDFDHRKSFLNEIEFLQKCKSDLIINLLHVDVQKRFIVLERGDRTLKKALLRNIVSVDEAIEFVEKAQIDFKKHKIIHRDLSCRNIVIFLKTRQMKFIDFEIASLNSTNLENIYYKHREIKDNFELLKRQIYNLKPVKYVSWYI